jgi:hypothetical protein
MAGDFQTKVLFEAADSQVKGETTVIQLHTHPSQQRFFALLGKTACRARAYLEPHSPPNSTEFEDWLVGGPAN